VTPSPAADEVGEVRSLDADALSGKGQNHGSSLLDVARGNLRHHPQYPILGIIALERIADARTALLDIDRVGAGIFLIPCQVAKRPCNSRRVSKVACEMAAGRMVDSTASLFVQP
jgi:hypothetical protein